MPSRFFTSLSRAVQSAGNRLNPVTVSVILLAVVAIVCAALLLPFSDITKDTPAATVQEETNTSGTLFNAASFTLDNGMQVVVIPNERAPVVHHMVWYRVGAADEPPGQSGLAHFVEHLMFKGTDNVPPGEFARIVRSLGGTHNAFTSQDYTAYYQTVSRDHLETVMKLEADRMTNLAFPPEEVKAERQVVIEERRQNTENDPRGYFYEQMRATLFLNDPYGDPVIGWLHEVDALDRPHVKKFYETWYAPNNAILVVGGDITAEELKPLAKAIYGAIPQKDVPERDWTEVPPLIGLNTLTLEDPSIRQPILVRMVRAPGHNIAPEEALALQLLEESISGNSTTRLYKTLVIEQKMATSASLSYDSYRRDDTALTLVATPAETVLLEDLEWTLDQFLKDLAENGITEEELADAKKRLKDKTVFLLDSVSTPSMIFGRALTTGGTVERVESWPARMEAVTLDEVNAVARKYLDPDNFGKRPYVTGYLRPAPADREDTAAQSPEDTTERPVAGEGDYQ